MLSSCHSPPPPPKTIVDSNIFNRIALLPSSTEVTNVYHIEEIEEIESDNEKESTLTGGKRKRRGGRLVSSEHIFSLVLVIKLSF